MITCTYRMLADEAHKFLPAITVNGNRADGTYKVCFYGVAVRIFNYSEAMRIHSHSGRYIKCLVFLF